MKNLILLALAFVMCGCVNIEIENPLNYNGAIITGKDKTLGVFSLQLCLTESQKDSIKCKTDYIWIEVTQLDYVKHNLGDTIKVTKKN